MKGRSGWKWRKVSVGEMDGRGRSAASYSAENTASSLLPLLKKPPLDAARSQVQVQTYFAKRVQSRIVARGSYGQPSLPNWQGHWTLGRS
jgi:hypothetical protein